MEEPISLWVGDNNGVLNVRKRQSKMAKPLHAREALATAKAESDFRYIRFRGFRASRQYYARWKYRTRPRSENDSTGSDGSHYFVWGKVGRDAIRIGAEANHRHRQITRSSTRSSFEGRQGSPAIAGIGHLASAAQRVAAFAAKNSEKTTPGREGQTKSGGRRAYCEKAQRRKYAQRSRSLYAAGSKIARSPQSGQEEGPMKARGRHRWWGLGVAADMRRLVLPCALCASACSWIIPNFRCESAFGVNPHAHRISDRPMGKLKRKVPNSVATPLGPVCKHGASHTYDMYIPVCSVVLPQGAGVVFVVHLTPSLPRRERERERRLMGY